MILHKRIATMLLGGLLLAIPSLQAVILPPGSGPVPPDDFTAFGGNDVIGAQVGVTLISPALATTFTGIIKSAVFTDNYTGDLDFVYQYTALTGESVERITVASFDASVSDGFFADPFAVGGPGVDVGHRNDPFANLALSGATFIVGTKMPDGVTRSASSTIVGFNFDGANAISPGGTSEMLIVRTHATTFTMGQGGVIDSQTANVSVWAPSPEPRLASLAALALFGLVAFFFRRRKVQASE